ncbi:TIGR02391 family protein [Undibacterium sp. Tian12W]|uniref:TIGR02391 family protein n=1 Tax=Undibacterium sp. Tian12W TaxID=3413054 RepID=UPI003BF26B31
MIAKNNWSYREVERTGFASNRLTKLTLKDNMRTIFHLLDSPVILEMTIEDLAYSLLVLACENSQNGHFHPSSFINANGTSTPAVDIQIKYKVERAVQEALVWLESQVLVAPEADTNGGNGWKFITRRGAALGDRAKFKNYQAAAAFPKNLLHPIIADQVWSDLARGDFPTAVFRAFKAVEEAVREAAGLAAEDIGVKLMHNAFGQSGALTDQSVPASEQVALANLFAGAIGSYKNPHSHRTVTIRDMQDAQEMVMLASHLLRIVDERKS